MRFMWCAAALAVALSFETIYASAQSPTDSDYLIWCEPKFDHQVPKSVCEQTFRPKPHPQPQPKKPPVTENYRYGQPSDPYAQSYAVEYKRDREAFLNTIRTVYFAVGCRVISAEWEVLPLMTKSLRSISIKALQFGGDRDLEASYREAQRDGLARASQATACDYWHQNPSEVVRVRRMVGAANY